MSIFALLKNLKVEIILRRKRVNPILRFGKLIDWNCGNFCIRGLVLPAGPNSLTSLAEWLQKKAYLSHLCNIFAKLEGFFILEKAPLSFSFSQGNCNQERRASFRTPVKISHKSYVIEHPCWLIFCWSSSPLYCPKLCTSNPVLLVVCKLSHYRLCSSTNSISIEDKVFQTLGMGESEQKLTYAENGKRKRDIDESEASGTKDKVVDPSEYTILKEGEAEILMHGNDVFYNKTQVVNRDVSIAVLRAFVAMREKEFLSKSNKHQNLNGGVACPEEPGSSSSGVLDPADTEASLGTSMAINLESDAVGTGEASSSTSCQRRPLCVLEALAASGLRALRYAREVEGVASVVALDNDTVAVEACARNIKLNGTLAASKVQARHADARIYMLTHEKEFDVVDLDPYGSPSVFLDSAVQSVADGGILMCTATDMAVLCGNNGEVCYSKYGAYSLRAKYCHEMALRILLASIESHANRYKRHIVPLISISVDFYVRVFVRIYTSANAMKETPSKLSYVYQCVGCDCYHLQPVGRAVQKNNSRRYMPGIGPAILPNCKQCGKHFNMGGPIWSAPIHDPNWVDLTLAVATKFKTRHPAYEKIHSILTAVSEELLDIPLFVSLHSMSATLKCTPPSSVIFRSAVVNAGYRVSGSHANPLGLKTDAPMDVIWDIMRCWVKQHPVKAQAAEMAGSVILSKEPELEANFSRARGAQSHAQSKGVARFLPNPEDYWGPKPRAGRRITDKHAALVGTAFSNGKFCHVETHKESNERDEPEVQHE
ncbi:hypothetical protein O6H91_02G153100 [Diphasiastrum complanatum]|uniref:Uncharacterized protein n=1 Tax=Diphasiastrum complanatum TaxID=34168 RepID=A0ACC2EM25_DIPCM|nr:hypothetical protein O6H91_02G153100 [Diphasiastrum complanatum]